MKKLLCLLFLLALSAHAQAVNNRTFIIDAASGGGGTPVGWRVYCGTTADPATFAPTAVKDTPLPALNSGVVALADTVRFCAAKFYTASGLESGPSNVIAVTAPNAPVLRVTMVDTFALDEATQVYRFTGREITARLEQGTP